ncbi:MAG: PEP-CTERM sorting domain-containing protein [Planctomycetota bacterium]
MMKPTTCQLLATLAISAACSGAVIAAPFTLLSDDFEDGNRDGWFQFDQGLANGNDGQPGLVISVVGSPDSALNGGGSNNELRLEYGDSGSTRGLYTYFNPVTLATPGDFIELTFLASNRSAIDTNIGSIFSEGLRFGFFDSQGSQPEVEGIDIGDSNDIGFFAAVDTNASTSSDSAELHDTVASASTPLTTGGNAGRIANDDNDGDPDPLSLSLNDFFEYQLRFEVNALNGLDILLANNETPAPVLPGDPDERLTATVALPSTTTFDALYLGLFNVDGSDIRIDDVLVTTNVPEPSSLLLAGLGTAMLLTRRRR